MTSIAYHSKVYFSRFPLKRLPQTLSTCMKIKMVNEIFFSHPPREIFVEDIALLVEEVPE